MAKKIKSKALQFVYGRYIGEDRALAAAFEEELLTADIASQIYNLRRRAGLSQRQLAAKVGTTASVICRLKTRTTMVTPSPCSSELPPPWVDRSRSSLSRPVAGVPLHEAGSADLRFLRSALPKQALL